MALNGEVKNCVSIVLYIASSPRTGECGSSVRYTEAERKKGERERGDDDLESIGRRRSRRQSNPETYYCVANDKTPYGGQFIRCEKDLEIMPIRTIEAKRKEQSRRHQRVCQNEKVDTSKCICS
ncbi:hypothetical protein PUN28_017259 [Cardiocondyla obscurior]|uniref:Uncharacterized protein n=1 Tax=Cardiocondyla obscurior TaxID=286306 RepID=A0AAW2ENQ2_9HYME